MNYVIYSLEKKVQHEKIFIKKYNGKWEIYYETSFPCLTNDNHRKKFPTIITQFNYFKFCRSTKMNETTTTNLTEVDVTNCPIYEKGDDLTIAKFSFWLEGVVQCCVAISGLVGNFISAFILTR